MDSEYYFSASELEDFLELDAAGDLQEVTDVVLRGSEDE